jgi:hypothetical protein
LAAPQRGSQASSDGPTGCWAALRTQEESPSRADLYEGLSLRHRSTLEFSRFNPPGASAQYFTGVLLEANGRDFNPIFLVTSGVEVLGVLAFCSWWSSERQFD